MKNFIDEQLSMLEDRIEELEEHESTNSWVIFFLALAVAALAIKVVLL